MTASKEHLRREIRAQLRSMSRALHAEASLVICQTVAHLPAFMDSRCVALFAPLASEPDIHPLIEEAWARGKKVALPLMLPTAGTPELDWHLVTNWDEVVVPGPLGVREPDPSRCPKVPPAEIDGIFVPGLAFDHEGFRLGRGGGYYDRFLSLAPPRLPRIGLMFALQRVALVPREAHDQALHGVVTEDEVTTFPLAPN